MVKTINEIEVGERYEVKPKQFHRAITGRVAQISGEKILFEVEHCDLIDKQTASHAKLVEADFLDIKKPLTGHYFFS